MQAYYFHIFLSDFTYGDSFNFVCNCAISYLIFAGLFLSKILDLLKIFSTFYLVSNPQNQLKHFQILLFFDPKLNPKMEIKISSILKYIS